jgi:hypothetical protein
VTGLAASGRAVPVAGGRGARADRVLRRAIELAAEEGGGPSVVLTPQHLREVAAELAIPDSALTVALAEEQVAAGLPPAGPLSTLVGPVAVVGWRHIGAGASQAERLLVRWLEEGYALRVRQLGDGTLVGTRRPGVAGSLARTAVALRGGRDLAGRGEVRAAVVDEPGAGPASVACVLVDLRRRRRESLGGGSLVGLVGMAASAVLAATVTPLALAGLPVAAGAGLAVAALHHRATVREVTEEVEATLHALTRREAPEGPVRRLVRSVIRRDAAF